MEEEKTIGPKIPRGPGNSFGTALWQWQSGPNPDPWAEKDARKWFWQDYSHDDSLIIEEAFSLKKDVADLGNCEIDLKRMLQVNKESKSRIHRVRRQEKSRFMMEMSEPIAVVKDQKTMNQAFGTVQHFLDYIMKRTPEAYGLYQRLKMLSLESQIHEYEDIVKEVIACIEKGAALREDIVKARSGSQEKHFIIEANQIVNIIKEGSTVLGDFLRTVLRVYTMETFICYWLNELLRSENWEEINVLTPFLVCLVYTFKRSEYIIQHQEPQGLMNSLFALVRKQKLYLYRGAALTKEHLELYDPKKIGYFSWNGVTSTSKDKNVALSFIRFSLGKVSEKRVGVFFKIETDFAGPDDCEGMIDIFQNSCSQYPDEQEVILAPGTVFQLISTRFIENNICEVSLKVKRKFEEAKGKIALLGSLQDQAILKDKAIIDGLPAQESFRLIELLKGNKLIRNLEVRNSGVEEHIMEEIEDLRVTTNVKREDVKLRNNVVVVGSLDLLAHYYSAENLSDILMSNKIRFKRGGADKKKEGEIQSLVLNEKVFERFKRSSQLEELSEKIKDSSLLTRLDLSVNKIEGSSDEIIKLLRELKSWQSLKLKVNQAISVENLGLLCQAIGSSRVLTRLSLETSLEREGFGCLGKALVPIVSAQNLSLNWKIFKGISDFEVDYLNSALLSLASLHSLSLNFDGCSEISNKGLASLKNCLLSLGSLQSLDLNFEQCAKISDEGLDHLKTGLISLTSLRHLSMGFGVCSKISDEGLNHIKDALVSLTFLKYLSMDFNKCIGISGDGLSHLKDALLSLTSLHNLSLNFSECREISNEGLNHLKNALVSLTSLEYLSLDLSSCNEVSDDGLNHIKSSLLSLTSLQNLSMNFTLCRNISNEGLGYLKDCLISLKSLQHLSLNFAGCDKVSDQGLNHLQSALISLTSLQHFSLNLRNCVKLSNEGLGYLKDGLTAIRSLQHLSLDFSWCDDISDEGLNHLKAGLIPLTSLQHLSMSFKVCDEISDEGLNHLKDALASLTSLESFSLDLSSCTEMISDEGLNHLKSGLKSLTSLQHLSLDFSWCSKISNQGLNHLKHGLLPLLSLQHLSVNFERCHWISDEGLGHLKSLLQSLTLLQRLSLNFRKCYDLPEKGLNHLKSGLVSLTFLQDLSLDFFACRQISEEGLNEHRDQFKFLRKIDIRK